MIHLAFYLTLYVPKSRLVLDYSQHLGSNNDPCDAFIPACGCIASNSVELQVSSELQTCYLCLLLIFMVKKCNM